MDALKMLKAAKRFCKEQATCTKCPLEDPTCPFDMAPQYMSEDDMNRAISFLTEWDKFYPGKTRADLFFERNPEASPEIGTGVPFIAPCNYLGNRSKVPQCSIYVKTSCKECRIAFWKEVVE